MASVLIIGILLTAFVGLQTSDTPGQTPDRLVKSPAKATGPLRVSSVNPRYFADGSGRLVYLTGSHTWSNFRDFGNADPPRTFNYAEYLDFLERHNHNFIRLWTLELLKASYNGKARYATFWPWLRTGPGLALDGNPRFDLRKFNKEYFDRLRSRVIAAGERGLYVSIMLFNGYGLQASDAPWRWDGHPFNFKNNVNEIGRDLETDEKQLLVHTLSIPEVKAIQEAYVMKVIDAVNDLDNVLYEISNESGSYSTEWQYHFIRFVKSYETTKPNQHPVGMTFQYGPVYRGRNETLFFSPADWISPGAGCGYEDDPPPAEGNKVIIADTDHLWGIGGDRTWVWKSFLRGLNPIYMDPYGDTEWGEGDESVRKSMGDTLTYSRKMSLVEMTPHGELTSTGYALANPGWEYLIYAPPPKHWVLTWLDRFKLTKGLQWLQEQFGLTKAITVNLTGSSSSKTFQVEWFNPRTAETASGGVTSGETRATFRSPFVGDVVLYLHAQSN